MDGEEEQNGGESAEIRKSGHTDWTGLGAVACLGSSSLGLAPLTRTHLPPANHATGSPASAAAVRYRNSASLRPATSASAALRPARARPPVHSFISGAICLCAPVHNARRASPRAFHYSARAPRLPRQSGRRLQSSSCAICNNSYPRARPLTPPELAAPPQGHAVSDALRVLSAASGKAGLRACDFASVRESVCGCMRPVPAMLGPPLGSVTAAPSEGNFREGDAERGTTHQEIRPSCSPARQSSPARAAS